MFENRFNSKKVDPLVEAVKQAQADGEMRREAIAIVNEAFSVYSRNAVVREELAEYDAAIEEVYADLKEGSGLRRQMKKIDRKSGEYDQMDQARVRGQIAGSKGKEGNPYPKGKRHDEYEHGKKNVKEGLSPAQNRELDVHDDDKIDGKDFAILRARKKHMKEETQIDEVSKGRAISAYREKEAQGRDGDKLHGLIKRKFGKDTAHHAERAAARDTGNLVRRGEDHGTDRLKSARPSSDMRKTGKGEIYKQDVNSKKSEMKFRKLMGKFSKKPNLPEGYDQIDEAIPYNNLVSANRINSGATPSTSGSTATGGATGAVTTMPRASHNSSRVSSHSARHSTVSASAKTSTGSTGGKSSYFSGSPNVSKGDYTIQKGDTLSAIAKRSGTSVNAIQSMNKGLTDVNKIAAGGKLNMPTVSASKQVGPPAPQSSSTQKWADAGKMDYSKSNAGASSTSSTSGGGSTSSVSSSSGGSTGSGNSPTSSLGPSPTMNRVSPAPTPSATTPSNDATNRTKSPSSMVAESVQVGANRYRIV